MGRSVSYPSNCAAVCFRDVSSFGAIYEEIFNEDGDFEDYNYDNIVGHDAESARDDWDNFVENIRSEAMAAWPSLEEADRWLDREDRVILENNFAMIGVSEYCGLASVWLKSKSDDLANSYYSDEVCLANLADSWVNRISGRFEKLFGEYRKVAAFSNGEAFFERVA